jgi:carbon-monoxide dehydrogenase medium subunit
MKPLPYFEYHRPVKCINALKLLSSLDNPKILAGGTDLLPQMRDNVFNPDHIIDINNITKLSNIEEKDKLISIGSTVNFQQIFNSSIVQEKLPALHDAISQMGSPQIRNRATLGGNICNASPAADSAPPLYVYESEAVVKSIDETKTIPIDQIFRGSKINCLEPNELITEIRVPIPPSQSASCFLRIGRRKAFTLSIVSTAVYLEMEDTKCIDARIALGSVSMTPIRIHAAEYLLKGKKISDDLIDEVCEICIESVNPISDVRGTAEYRKDMSGILVKRAILKTLEQD